MKNPADPSIHDAVRLERGWALLSVLWIVVALSLLAAATETLTSNTYRLERTALERDRIDAALDAGVVRAVLGIEAPDVNDRWRVDGTPRQFEFDRTYLTISVQDELGRFDLNVIDASILSALLKAEHVPRDKAVKLVDSILDWRNPSDLRRLHGAGSADYAAEGLRYRPRHGPYQSVNELRLVLGMTPEIFERIRPALTVYTKNPMIDPIHATREALLALHAGDERVVDDILKARSTAASNGLMGIADPNMSFAGRTFSITVSTHLGQHLYQHETVVMLTGDPKQPYLTLAWS